MPRHAERLSREPASGNGAPAGIWAPSATFTDTVPRATMIDVRCGGEPAGACRLRKVNVLRFLNASPRF